MDYFKGDFFEGVYIEDAPEFEDWLDGRRAHYRFAAASLLVTQGEAALASNTLVAAQKAAREALQLAPTLEPAMSVLMRATVLAGDTVGALRVYEEFRSNAGAEIPDGFTGALKALSERIAGDRWRRRSKRSENEAPLIGRSEVHSNAFSLLEEGLRQYSPLWCQSLPSEPNPPNRWTLRTLLPR